MVTVSENAWSQNPKFAGSSLMWIEPGKDVSIEDLQRGDHHFLRVMIPLSRWRSTWPVVKPCLRADDE